MTIWLIKDGENLPIQGDARKMRMWLLADELLRRGHKVIWWTTTFFHPHKTLLAAEDRSYDLSPDFQLRLIHAGGYKRNFSVKRHLQNRRWGKRLRQAMEQAEAPDVVVTAFPIIHSAWQAVAYSRGRKIPVVVDVRDLWPETFLDFVPPFLRGGFRTALWNQFRMTRELLAQANGIVAISEGCLDWALRMAQQRQGCVAEVIHSGYPDPGTPRIGRAPAPPMRFIYVGSFGRSYAVEQLLKAAQLVQQRKPGAFHFLLVGDGEQRARLQQEFGALENVSMTGWLDRGQLRSALDNAHVGIVPGPLVSDAFPNKAFEYLANGLPLLSCVPGELHKEIVEHGIGWHYETGDAAPLAELILRLGAAPADVDARGSRARNVYEARFRSDSLYSRYADLVEQAVQRPYCEVPS